MGGKLSNIFGAGSKYLGEKLPDILREEGQSNPIKLLQQWVFGGCQKCFWGNGFGGDVKNVIKVIGFGKVPKIWTRIFAVMGISGRPGIWALPYDSQFEIWTPS